MQKCGDWVPLFIGLFVAILVANVFARFVTEVSHRGLRPTIDAGRGPQRKAWRKDLGAALAILAEILSDVLFAASLKIQLSAYATAYFIFSRELRVPRSDVKAARLAAAPRRKIVYFIRHGQSVWNSVAHRGSMQWLPGRVVVLGVMELSRLFAWDSVILDSPLSAVGLAQAVALERWIAKESTEMQNVLSRQDVVIATSNLRRAIGTCLIAFGGHLQAEPDRKIHVMRCLQEATRNADGLAIPLDPGTSRPPMSVLESQLKLIRLPLSPSGVGSRSQHRLYAGVAFVSPDAAMHDCGSTIARGEEYRWLPSGQMRRRDKIRRFLAILKASLVSVCRAILLTNKGLFESLADRHDQFLAWLDTVDDTTPVVVVGHSAWIRHFVNRFADGTQTPTARRKLDNCAVMCCEVVKEQDSGHSIDGDTIRLVYGGVV